jgi:hypothetical protein
MVAAVILSSCNTVDTKHISENFDSSKNAIVVFQGDDRYPALITLLNTENNQKAVCDTNDVKLLSPGKWQIINFKYTYNELQLDLSMTAITKFHNDRENMPHFHVKPGEIIYVGKFNFIPAEENTKSYYSYTISDNYQEAKEYFEKLFPQYVDKLEKRIMQHSSEVKRLREKNKKYGIINSIYPD